MKEIILAETAGFCFGVDRAVQTVQELLKEGKKVATLGPIIHNPQLVAELQAKGARIVDEPEQVKDDEVLVIRSHGVAKEVIERAEKTGVAVSDATCPFVSKIHKIVSLAGDEGRTVLIAGDKEHKDIAQRFHNCVVYRLIHHKYSKQSTKMQEICIISLPHIL